MTTEERLTIQQPRTVLKTPQSLIHIKHTISLLQYKYWIILLQDMKDQMNKGIPAEMGGFRFISMSKIMDLMEIDYIPKKKELWDTLRTLKNQDIVINFLEKDGQQAKYGAGFISEWTVSNNRVGYKFPLFLEAVMQGDGSLQSMFQLLNWDVFNSFTGKYEAIIYKLCKDYIGVGCTPYMTIEEYREYVGLRAEEYTEFKKLNQWTISKPIQLINSNDISDIDVRVEYRKEGRSVVGLYFRTNKRKQQKLPFPELEPITAFRYAKVTISIEDQHQYLEKMSPELIEATIERANEYADTLKQQGKKVQMGGIYKKAFSERWGVQHLEAKRAEQAEKTKLLEVKKAERTKAQAEKAKEKQEEAERKERQAKILQAFSEQSEDVQNQILDTIESRAGDFIRGFLTKDRKNKNMSGYILKCKSIFVEVMQENGLID